MAAESVTVPSFDVLELGDIVAERSCALTRDSGGGDAGATGGVNADVFIMRVNGTHEGPVTQTALYDSYPDWGATPSG